MLAYLTLLYDPTPPQLIGIEEPENYLHPRLLPGLAEEFRSSSSRSQLLVTTHSPYFVNGLRPRELWVLYRDEKGFTQAKSASQMKGIPEFIESGSQLGYLWAEGFFEVGDPLTNAGGPKATKQIKLITEP
jgi:predicted ATPase